MRLVRYSYPTFRTLAPSFDGFTRSPWSGLESEIDRLFGAALSDFTSNGSQTGFPVDLYEDKNNTYVRAELPGVNRDDISVEMVDDFLNLSAARKEGEESFSFSRSIRIEDDVQADKVTAAYENGVLTVTLPKREETKPKKITVSVK